MRNGAYEDKTIDVGKRKMNMKKFEIVFYVLGVLYWINFMCSL